MNIDDLEVRLKKLEDENLILKEQLSELLVRAYELKLNGFPVMPTYPNTWVGNPTWTTSGYISNPTQTITGNYTYTLDGLKITY